MTLTNESIISSIKEKLNIPEDRASHLLETVLEIMRTTLVNGGQFHMIGVGIFSVYKRRKTKGKNSSTNPGPPVETMKAVSFRCSPTLRKKLNGPEWVQCPKCLSRGMKSYEYYIVANIVKGIIDIKSGSPPKASYKSDLILLCPVCKGDGMIDWTTSMLGGLQPFGELNGCLDIFMKYYWNRASQQLVGMKKKGIYFMNGVSPWNFPKGRTEWPEVEQVIESSRQRYQGSIKLNQGILSKGIRELKGILKHLNYLEELKGDEFDAKVQSYLTANGLFEFVPDVYASPIEDDLLPI